jgi:hypothetical protein
MTNSTPNPNPTPAAGRIPFYALAEDVEDAPTPEAALPRRSYCRAPTQEERAAWLDALTEHDIAVANVKWARYEALDGADGVALSKALFTLQQERLGNTDADVYARMAPEVYADPGAREYAFANDPVRRVILEVTWEEFWSARGLPMPAEPAILGGA